MNDTDIRCYIFDRWVNFMKKHFQSARVASECAFLMSPTLRAKVVVAFDRYTDDTYKVVDHNFDFYVGDRVKINRTSGFSRGSHGTVVHIITDQYEIRYMVKRDGSDCPIYFFADELDLIENS